MPPQIENQFNVPNSEPKQKFPRWVKFVFLGIGVLLIVGIGFVVYWNLNIDGCRQNALNIIKIGNYSISNNGNCEIGYHTNQLKCVDSPVWCEPNQATFTDQFADWKTYRNEEYGFEFKYPANWVLTGNEIPDLKFGLSLKSDPNKPMNEILAIVPLGIGPNTVFEGMCDERKDIIFTGKNAIECINGSEFYYEKSIRIKDAISLWSPENIISYKVIKFEGADVNNLISLYNQILSTFKFTK